MTALEWLEKEMQRSYFFNQDDFDMFKQAKALERQQIINAYSHGWHDGQDVIIKQVRHINLGGDKAGEKYYSDMKGTDL